MLKLPVAPEITPEFVRLNPFVSIVPVIPAPIAIFFEEEPIVAASAAEGRAGEEVDLYFAFEEAVN